MVAWIALLNVLQKVPDRFASRGEEGQAYHDEKYPLKDRKEKTDDPKSNENPADDQNPDLLKTVHCTNLLNRPFLICKDALTLLLHERVRSNRT